MTNTRRASGSACATSSTPGRGSGPHPHRAAGPRAGRHRLRPRSPGRDMGSVIADARDGPARASPSPANFSIQLHRRLRGAAEGQPGAAPEHHPGPDPGLHDHGHARTSRCATRSSSCSPCRWRPSASS
ncbi:MAG: hypothetical protein M0C28_47600 [Candidatus Moduliflexus flocculans]|nr:hypothetical protein [Candidatus Moduliflexus flocculans]